MSLAINLIDIGAVGGLGQPWRGHPRRLGVVLGFEPNEPPKREGRRWTYDTAIWDRNGRAPFFISGPDGSGASLLEQDFAWVEANFERLAGQGDRRLNATWRARAEITRVVEVEVRTLDAVLGEFGELGAGGGGRPRFPFLKSDTQSGEWFVLQGAQRYLERECLGLELELFRYPLYRGMVLADQVRAWLAQLGFRVAGWTGWQNSFASQADFLFLRSAPRDAGERAAIEAIEAIYRPAGPERLIKQTPAVRRWLRRGKRLIGDRLPALAGRR